MTLRRLPTLVLLSLALASQAQQRTDAPEALFQRSQERGEGLVHRLATTAPRTAPEAPRDPYQELRRRAGLRTDAHKTTDYEYHSVTGYGGYVVPVATVADGNGNLYVTGSTTRGGDPRGHQFIAKLDAQGDTLWMVLEAGTKYAVEHGIAITLSADGTPLVAGSYWNGTDMDIRLTSYDAQGNTLWQQVYAGDADGVDMPTALAVDGDGDVLVTGLTWTGVGVSYITVKYNPGGSLLWTATDNGVGGDTWSEPAAITTDAMGNVYVTGFSENAQYWTGYYTVKYSASGEAQWQQRYTYTGPPSINNSFARALAVDAEGSVYVTGTIDRGNSRFGTIKYTTDGDELWMQTYRSGTEFTDAYGIALGTDDVLYVGGEHNGEFSDDGFVLVAYSTEGDELWAQETDDLIDITVEHLTVDAGGNAVIAGIGSYMLDPENFIMVRAAQARRYSAAGDVLDVVTHQAAAVDTIGFIDLVGLDVDADNGIALTLNTFYTSQGSKSTTVRFAEATTEPAWIREVHDPLGNRTRLLDGFADDLGNSYCTGDYLTFTNGLNTTRVLLKHDATGAIAWRKYYDTAVDGPGAGIIAAPGEAGTIRVYSVPEDDFTGEPLTLRVQKLDGDGNELWVAEKDLLQPSVHSIVTDVLGNTFLCGSARAQSGDGTAFVVVKLDAAGNEAWTTFSSVAGASTHGAGNAVATNDGGVVLPGAAGTGGWFESDLDFIVTRFNVDGTVAWATPVDVDNGSGGAVAAVVDDAGNIYATGAVQDQTTTEYDHLTAKISPAGTVLWSARHGDQAHDERMYTIKLLTTGDVVVVGYQIDLSDVLHNVVIRYDADGTEAWTAQSPEAFFYRDFRVDEADNSYILDQVFGNTFPQRIFNGVVYSSSAILKIDADGNVVEEEHVDGPELSEFYPERLFAHADGRLVIAGGLVNESFFEGIYLHGSMLELPTAIPSVDARSTSAIGTAYPNPFTDRTRIAIDLSTAAPVSVLVHDQQGRLVQQVAARTYAAGKHMVEIAAAGLAPGHYLYELTVGTARHNGKVVVE